ncbi:hypothetical protein B0H67DRAFT_200851 [Lasiosphaeris hirsuta]|uniref:Secreted protein n=1 Tax=Lasiosphaeris hirsuta TaxID=260670 RepID=A0AA40ARL5_9PEZI|nr:hypothetical protein B0H67DRAFT_200851 [Lasiosphaeris hirsuta]
MVDLSRALTPLLLALLLVFSRRRPSDGSPTAGTTTLQKSGVHLVILGIPAGTIDPRLTSAAVPVCESHPGCHCQLRQQCRLEISLVFDLGCRSGGTRRYESWKPSPRHLLTYPWDEGSWDVRCKKHGVRGEGAHACRWPVRGGASAVCCKCWRSVRSRRPRRL